MQVVVERFVADAEERGQQFMVSILSKQQQRLKGLFDRHIVRNYALKVCLRVADMSYRMSRSRTSARRR